MHYRGHPNRKLVTVRFPAGTPGLQVSGELFHGTELAGHLTSLARSPRDGELAGLAMIRYPLAAERTPLAAVAGAPAQVRTGPVATDLGTARA
jgi:glycine cleavage system aminomethyltransferase T